MTQRRDIIKIFHEEPFFLEVTPPDEESATGRRSTELGALDALLPGDFAERPVPRSEDDLSEDALDRPRPFYRLYIAGTDMAADRTGATAISRPEVWAGALRTGLPSARFWCWRQGVLEELPPGTFEAEVTSPDAASVVVAAHEEPFAELVASVASEGPVPTADLKRLLEDGVAVLLREPAHHGYDWSIYSVEPLSERLEVVLAAHLKPGVRVFIAPYQKARSEERFYFERWALDDPPPWVREVASDE